MVQARAAPAKIGRYGWVLGLIGLVLAACRGEPATPTLVPTLTAAPTHTAVATPAPSLAVLRPTATFLAPGFPSWRTVVMESGQSFDFRQETLGGPTAGDLYYIAAGPRQRIACLWANNEGQQGGRDLGSFPLTALPERPLPRDRYTRECLSVIQGHVYAYGLADDQRLAVFRVADAGLTTVTLEYLLRR